MTPQTYKLIERCVEDGVAYGYQRAFKHNDNPSEDSIRDAIVDAVMIEICEWFDFSSGAEE